MRALTMQPGKAGSAAVEEVAEPAVAPSEYLVESLQVGLCGTDAEILAGKYGEPPAGEQRLVLGHEAVGRVMAAPDGATARPGDLVVPIVRVPDPVPCPNCAAGEWDMCLNGRYTEHGIKGVHGFARERYALDPRFVVPVPDGLDDLAVLIEPASIVAKAWDQIDRISARSHRAPRTVVVAGAGPIGLLAALMGAQRQLEVDVVDLVTGGPKPKLVADLGATYHSDGPQACRPEPDIIIECTGVGSVVIDAIEAVGRTGIVCLAGISSGARALQVDAAALNRRLVLENAVIFGTVNANRRHYDLAAAALAAADPTWIRRLVTRRLPLERWPDAIDKQPTDVKVVLTLTTGADADTP